jgi:hypothetical protein
MYTESGTSFDLYNMVEENSGSPKLSLKRPDSSCSLFLQETTMVREPKLAR